MTALARAFFARDPLDVAPDLVGKVMVAGPCAGRIVEVEAYRGRDDPGSHGHRGPTPRTAVMHGPAGHLYVYFSYGMHWCANVVCGADGVCAAVLIRALAPLRGLDLMWSRRPAARRERDLCSGPAKLCSALAIDGRHDGIDCTRPDGAVFFDDDGAPTPATVASKRIGLSPGRGEHLPWRFLVADDPNVSAPAVAPR